MIIGSVKMCPNLVIARNLLFEMEKMLNRGLLKLKWKPSRLSYDPAVFFFNNISTCDSDPVDTVGSPDDELLFGAATPGGGASGVGDVLLEIGGWLAV